MRSKISKGTFSSRIKALFSSPVALASTMESTDTDQMPEDLTEWLGRLNLLYGVPYNYLIADAEMLPAESIRFFYLDPNWVDALVDGASSIGRVPSSDTQSAGGSASFANSSNMMALKEDPQTREWLKKREQKLSSRIAKDLDAQKFIKGSKTMNLDRAMLSHARKQIEKQSNHIRRNHLGYAQLTTESATSSGVISGFILRSEVVTQYPGLAVNAFEKGHTPNDGDAFEAMTILRMERLGDQSDVLLCILEGDAYRVDISEAPEQLHFGLDDRQSKTLKTYVKGATVDDPDPNHIELNDPQITPWPVADITNYLRPDDNRTINIAEMGSQFVTVLKNNNVNLDDMDSAIFGFEMTEGVGMVTFNNETTP